LLEFGVQPDILVCRTEHELTPAVRTKVAKFCNVVPQAVIQSIDASTIYDVPLLMLEEGFDTVVLQKLGMKNKRILYALVLTQKLPKYDAKQIPYR